LAEGGQVPCVDLRATADATATINSPATVPLHGAAAAFGKETSEQRLSGRAKRKRSISDTSAAARITALKARQEALTERIQNKEAIAAAQSDAFMKVRKFVFGLEVLIVVANTLSDAMYSVWLIAYSEQTTLGWASVGILLYAFFTQTVLVKMQTGVPWCSYDIACTAVGLGSARQAYKKLHPMRYPDPKEPGTWSSHGVFNMLRCFDVLLETMPELVLQVMVLAAPGEWWYLQAISLATTVASAVLLLVLTEVSLTSTDESHRLYGGTWGWQRPMSTRKWGVTLFTLALFLGGNLLLAVTSAAIVSRSYPVSLACVLLTDCGLYLLTKAVLDQEFDQVTYVSDVPSNTLRLLTVDPLLNALTWAFIHFCPLPVLRHPMWVAPHNYARIVLCNLGEGAVFIALALNSGEANVVYLARYVCMPSLCVALITLVTFMLLIERRFWWTFCWRWSRRADVRARWIDLLHDPTDEDQSHRKMIEDPKHKLRSRSSARTWQSLGSRVGRLVRHGARRSGWRRCRRLWQLRFRLSWQHTTTARSAAQGSSTQPPTYSSWRTKSWSSRKGRRGSTTK
jgi:hypothetical protein